MIQS
jgi:hypothetical protein